LGTSHRKEDCPRGLLQASLLRGVEGDSLSAVLATVNPSKTYGVYYFNRERVVTQSVAEDTPEGRIYKKKTKRAIKEKSEWIGIPIPDAGIPKAVVEAARRSLEENKPFSRADNRFWELSGGIFRCGCCGRSMATHTSYSKTRVGKERYHYYRCQYAATHKELCSYRKSYRAAALEGQVWEQVSAFLKKPEKLEMGLERMIRQKEEEFSVHAPLEEAKKCQARISILDDKRKRYQEMAAEGLIDFAELKDRLQELEEEKEAAQREIDSLLHKGKQLEEMRRNKAALLEHLKESPTRQIDSLSPDERRKIYQIIGLRATTKEEGTVEVDGDLTELCFGILGPTSPSRSLPIRGTQR
jgi:Recombinase zinc beta ribbon domain